MCVLALAFAAHPRWRLVMIGNRDELHARPSAPLGRWADAEHVIAGRDREAGGTWLGVSDQGRFVVVTNRPNPARRTAGKTSRGALVADILSGTGRYAEPSVDNLDDFNPFNLIAVDGSGAQFLTNRPAPQRSPLLPGLYGLSNGALDEPWRKTERIKAMLANWLESGIDEFGPMFGKLRADAAPLAGPEDVPTSPIFILNPMYGTRCTTIVAVDADGNGRIAERRYDTVGGAAGETRIDFAWPAGVVPGG